MSHQVINDAPEASSDTDQSDSKTDDMRPIFKMMKRPNKEDKRFLDLYKLKKAGGKAP